MTDIHASVLPGAQAARAEAPDAPDLSVQVGSRVTLRSLGQSEAEIVIVASHRDAGLYRLPPQSPLARALLGPRSGDEVAVHTDAGTTKFTI